MNLGLDFHDTISYHTEFFTKLVKSWPGKVYVVTGTPPSKVHEIKSELEKLKIQDDIEDILVGFEYDKEEMSLEHFKKMAKHKLKLLQDNNIEVYFDDNPFYVSYIKDHGILTHQVIVSDKYLKEFEEGDPFFSCNLQKMQFDYLESLEDIKMLK
jgi:hypothetical protein